MPAARKTGGASAVCRHTRTRHQHGTRVAYVADGCRCAPCTEANRAYENDRNRLRTYGRWAPYVDAGPVREHVRACMAAGIGTRRICEVSGVSRAVVTGLLYGTQRGPGRSPAPSTKLRPEVAAGLLAVRVDAANLAGGALIDATGTRRRLQALVAIGWTRVELGRRIGVTPQNFTKLLTNERVTVRTAASVRVLYDELSMQPRVAEDAAAGAGANRARNSAAKLGWAPPLAWDDEDIDDPTAGPQIGKNENPGHGAYAFDRVEREDLVRSLHRQRCSDQEIARRTGMSDRTVLRIRRRLELPAVAA